MDEDWRNTFGILMCAQICDGAGVGIYDDAPSTCSSIKNIFVLKNKYGMFFLTIHEGKIHYQNSLRKCLSYNIPPKK